MKPDKIFEHFTRFFAIVLVATMTSVAILLFIKAWPAFQRFGLSFFFDSTWDPVAEHFGALPFIFGTLGSSLIALIIAVPFSLGIAIFLSELAPDIIGKTFSFLIELLAAIPSVIYGLWGVFYLVPWLRTSVEPVLIKAFGFLPFFKGPPYGIGLLAAGLILAIMIVPIISSIIRDVLKAVPVHQREAAWALGATRWEVTRMATLRYSRSGILGAIFLGLGRALGETMAVTMLIGNRPEISASILHPAHSMAAVLANEFSEATGEIYVSALMAIGFALFLVTLFINAGARALVWKVARGPKGGGHE